MAIETEPNPSPGEPESDTFQALFSEPVNQVPRWPYTWGRLFRFFGTLFDLLYRIVIPYTILAGAPYVKQVPAAAIFAGTHHSVLDFLLFRYALKKAGGGHHLSHMLVPINAVSWRNAEIFGKLASWCLGSTT